MPKASPIDDCDRPACDDVKTMFSKAMAATKTGGAAKTGPETSANPRFGKTTGIECPPSRSVIGKSSWNLLHSMVSRRQMNAVTPVARVMIRK